MSNGKTIVKKDSSRSGQNGQIMIETLLIMIVSLGLLMTTLNYFKESRALAKITNAIWAGVAEMAEYGTWPTAQPPIHPNDHDKVRIIDPTSD